MTTITWKSERVEKFETLRELSKELERVSEMLKKDLDDDSTEVLKKYKEFLLKWMKEWFED